MEDDLAGVCTGSVGGQEPDVLTASTQVCVSRWLRKRKDARYPMFSGTWDELVKLVASTDRKTWEPGLFDGTMLVRVPATGFLTRPLTDGLMTGFERHKAGGVKLVLWNRSALEKNTKRPLPNGVDWFIVGILVTAPKEERQIH